MEAISRYLPRLALAAGMVLLLAMAASVQAQDFGARLGTIKRGGRVTYEPTGPGVLFDALDPAMRKWYVPQELYSEYQWKQWEYSNYARTNYQRYVSTSLEGDYWYDVYGNYLTRGWLVYDWRQESPQPFGSTLEKSSQFSSWFSSLVVASDHKGQFHYALTVGNQLRTTLTPMTFSKALYNGLQWDFASDKHEATLVLSRISEPNSPGPETDTRTNLTNLLGARVTAQVGDFVKVGGTFVNAHHSQTQIEAVNGDIFRGRLTEAQNFGNVNLVSVRITDDSPEDGEGGGGLFSSDIIITDVDGNVLRGSQIGFRPLISGGFERRGFLAADGTEEIMLAFDFNDRTYSGPDPSEIESAQIELVVANDYFVEVASDRQVNAGESVVFLPVARASGNVKDGSNQRVLAFDYGRPTANQILGFTIEVDDLAGLEAYLEVDVNHQFRQYPNPNLKRHHTASDRATAWLLNMSKVSYPFFVFVEAYSVNPRYNTTLVVAGDDGVVDYTNDFQRFEFVDDNDDQDRRPDWRRKTYGPGDVEVFPGWDENNDFISDFNQNDNEDSPNLIPDYEEPFLRFYSDRPEFLFGIDMNHNGVVDRFENDARADYPYRKDQKGYNVYAGAHFGPEVRLTAGRMRVRQFTDKRYNRATYLLATAETNHPRWGRLRLFQDLRKVKDNIVDDLLQWQQLPNTRGGNRLVADRLPAQDTVVNTTWIGWDHTPTAGLTITHRLKWQLYHQLGSDLELELRGARDQSSFLGAINKAEYSLNLGRWTVSPRWKSEFRRETPLSTGEFKRQELSEIFMLVVRFPFMRRSFVEGGVDYEIFSQMRDPPPPRSNPDFKGVTSTLQMTNFTEYQGYRLTTTMGIELSRLDFGFKRPETRSRGFITIYAGVQE